MPAIYSAREAITVGGLTSYATDVRESYRQVGVYVGRILKGERPDEVPIRQVTKIEFTFPLDGN